MNPAFAAQPGPARSEALDVAVLVRRTHDLLAAGIPLTLLLDLAEDGGPHSLQHYRSEGGDAGWLPRPRRP